MKKWQIIESKMVFDLPWYKVRQDKVRLPSGKVLDDYLVSVRSDYVITFPVVEDGKVIILTQYKHGVQKFITEFPAGLPKKGESMEAAARRELREETGYGKGRFTKLAKLAENPTKSTNWAHIYLAEGLEKVGEQELDDEGEGEMKIRMVTFQELWQMIQKGEIETMPMVSAAIHALAHLKTIKEQ